MKKLLLVAIVWACIGIAFCAGIVTAPHFSRFPVRLNGIAEVAVARTSEEESAVALLVKESGVHVVELPAAMSALADPDLLWVVIVHMKGPLVDYDTAMMLWLPMADGRQYMCQLGVQHTREVSFEYLDVRHRAAKVQPAPPEHDEDEEHF